MKKPHVQFLIEICVESAEDAHAAQGHGANRIELNSALALDGLSPSPGLLMETRHATRLPVVVMARPRPGDFAYTATEFRTLRRDIDFAIDHGADGIAFGVLTPAGQIDVKRCRQVVRQIELSIRDAVFHRAFDATPDLFESLDRLMDLGVRRVMTSGGRRTALAGADVLRRLRERAAGRIELLPAGGIRPGNARQILTRTGCDQLHASLRDRGGRFSAALLSDLVKSTHARL